jgi:hypothetical protein
LLTVPLGVPFVVIVAAVPLNVGLDTVPAGVPVTVTVLAVPVNVGALFL